MKRQDIGAALVAWYRKNKRTLPWRYEPSPSGTPDPYRVWVSEIMLQQTTVGGVLSRYDRFISEFPTVQDLAAASPAQLTDAWAGLGYYARATNMHRTAKIIVSEYGGEFPADEKLLLSLPGVGDYTAAALMAIAFNRAAVALDGNGKRVVARLFAEAAPVKTMESRLKTHYRKIFDESAPSEFAQAMMDLGAMICTPTSPLCAVCPLQKFCKGKDRWRTIPHRPNKETLPIRYGALLFIGDSKGNVLLRRRVQKTMLAGCVEFIGTAWDDKANEVQANLWEQDLQKLQRTLKTKPQAWEMLPGEVSHTFTHYKLQLRLLRLIDDKVFAHALRTIDNNFVTDNLAEVAFPTLMKKAYKEFTR